MSNKIVRRFVVLILVMTMTVGAYSPAMAAPPSNDDFVNANAIPSLPFSAPIDITEATFEPSEPQDCVFSSQKTVWYAYTPAVDMYIRMSMEASAMSSNVNVYRSDGPGFGGLFFWACAQNSSLPPVFPVQAGTTYYFQVGSLLDGVVQLDLEEVPPPANDFFADAVTISALPFNDVVDVGAATRETDEPQQCAGTYETVWYSFTPSETILVKADADGSTWSPNINVYRADGPGFAGLASVTCTRYHSGVFLAEAGVTYLLQAGVQDPTPAVLNINLVQVIPPVNDDFADVEILTTLPPNLSVDLSGAGVEPGEPMGCNSSERSAWYSFTPAETIGLRIDTFNNNLFANVHVYSSNGPGFEGLSLMGCVFSGGSNAFTFQAGQVYFIQILGGAGILQVNLTQVILPPNDSFSNADTIDQLPFSASVDLTAATIEPSEPQPCYFMDKSIWYKFTPDEDMVLQADTQGSTINNRNIAVYQSSGPGITDLSFLKCSIFSIDTATFTAQAGQTYYFQVGNAFGDSGVVQFNLQRLEPPSNDDLANAEPVNSLPFSSSVNNSAGSLEPDEPQSCGLTMGNTAWYSFSPDETMTVRAASHGQVIGSVLAVYSSTGQSFTDLQFIRCTNIGSSTTFLAEAGQNYYLQVGGVFGESGLLFVDLEQLSPPANDNYADAEPFTDVPFSSTVDITDAWNEPSEPQYCYFMNRTAWYEFTPSETMTIRGTTDGSIIAANLNIYEQTGSSMIDLIFRGCSSSSGGVNFLAEAGKTYYLQAGDRFNQEGAIQINLQQVFPPANDSFANAEDIDQLPFTALPDITNAITEPNEGQFCYTMERTVWYRFAPDETVRVRADTQGGFYYGNVNIYRAAGPGISELQSLNCSGPFSAPTFTAEAGEVYYFQVGTAFGDIGPVRLNLTEVETISGRATDAITGAPLPGNAPPYSYVTLYRVCGDPCLEYVNAQQADGEGRFLFEGYYYGAPLFAGTYRIEITAHMYETRQFGPFEFSGTSLDLGDIGLNPPAVIRGRVVSELTGNPLPGSSVTLYRCDESGCNQYVNSQSADGSGGFLFNSFYYGAPLTGGMYEIEFSANLHVTRRFGVRINGGQDLDLGDVTLPPVPLIGSIRGTLLDKATGKPISSTFTPAVNLYRCYDSNCFEFVASQVPDSAGRFRFELDAWGNRIPAGQYQIVAFADQYEQGQTGPFDVAENMHAAIGSLRLVSFPVRFSHVQPCAEIPAAGGECVYSVRIWNGLSQDLEGSAWSMVNGSLPDTFIGYTEFQAKDKKDLDLDRGESRVVQFRFNVPANDSSYGTSLCARAFVGRDGNPNFNTLGIRQMFCVYWNAGGFTIASPEQALAFSQENAAVAASGTELEPNNSCQTAQDVGEPPYPFTLSGELDSSSAPDVDFYRFTGTPGVSVTIDLEGQATGMGTLPDPYLGFFDSNCNLVTTNDDSNGTLNSQLVITVPADGVFVLGATLCCDSGFFGGGNGTYQLTVTPVQTINSISGLVADLQTGRPLRGDAEPFAFVQLIRCTDTACFYMAGQPVGSDGRFRFTRDFNGAPLPVGNYRLELFATQYFFSQAGPFTVGEGEEFDVGEIRLTSFPVRFSSVNACTVPSNGGTCEFSVKITNGLPSRLSGRVWSVIDGFNLGSPANATTFQTGSTRDLRLDPGKSATVRFEFRVPGSVADGATICSRVYVGQNPDAQYNTVGLSYVFCIVKGSTGFTVLSDLEAQTFLQSQQILQLNTLQTPGPSIKKPE